eukprot:355093-Chlamydomonas_euryale.AAC.12
MFRSTCTNGRPRITSERRCRVNTTGARFASSVLHVAPPSEPLHRETAFVREGRAACSASLTQALLGRRMSNLAVACSRVGSA